MQIDADISRVSVVTLMGGARQPSRNEGSGELV